MWLVAALLLTDSVLVRPISLSPSETLEVTVAGQGSPVVLLPGLFGSAFGFRKIIPLLVEQGHEVIVVEPLGVGGSARPERGDYSLDAQASRIAAVLDTLGVRDAVVAAHSLGAGMAFRLAYRRPDLVAGLVSLDGGPAESAATPGLRGAAQWAPWLKVLGIKRVRKEVHRALIRASGDTSWVTEEVVDGYSAGASRDLDGTLRAYLRMSESREPVRLAPHLGEIRCPVHLLVGGAPHPEALPSRDLELLRDRLPRFQVDIVPGAGHHLHEERPAVVAAAIEAMSGLVARSSLAGPAR